jgi:hypothetical protein
LLVAVVEAVALQMARAVAVEVVVTEQVALL